MKCYPKKKNKKKLTSDLEFNDFKVYRKQTRVKIFQHIFEVSTHNTTGKFKSTQALKNEVH